MGKCVRCGKEIDAIAKDASKIFYCKECSFEVLKRSSGKFRAGENMYEEEETISAERDLYYLLPGVYQLKNKKRLDSLICFFALIIFIYALINYNSLEIKFKAIVYANTLLIYLKNFLYIKNS